MQDLAPAPAPGPSSCINLTTVLADPTLSQFVTLGRVGLLSTHVTALLASAFLLTTQATEPDHNGFKDVHDQMFSLQ